MKSNKRKKIICLLYIVVLAASCLAGCAPRITFSAAAFGEEAYYIAVGAVMQLECNIVAELSDTRVTVTVTGDVIDVKNDNKDTDKAVRQAQQFLKDMSVTWNSEDASVAVVDEAGNVKAVAAGSTFITALFSYGNENVTARVGVEVGTPVTQINIDESITLYAGEIKQLMPVVTPENATDPMLQFVSSDETVVTVDAAGLVTAKTSGEAEITISSSDRFATDKLKAILSVSVKSIGTSGEGGAMLQELLGMINAARGAQGIAPLHWSESLALSAAIRARELPVLFDHTRPDGSSYSSLNGLIRAENIAAGQPSAQAVFDAWMNSPGHRANIMNPSYTMIGMGYVNAGIDYSHYWCQLFG